MLGVCFTIALICVMQVASGAILSVCPKVGAPGSYTYDDSTSTGPSNWGKIKGNELCTTGQAQSPIDIPSGGEEVIGGRPKLEYMTAVMGLVSKTENWSLDCKEFGKCGHAELDGVRYDVKNIHFHAPSEHLLNGKRFPLEAHVVHVSSKGKIIVLATMFEDAKLLGLVGGSEVVSGIMSGICARDTTLLVPLQQLPKGLGMMSYTGSLTTPPCSEGVTFFMQKEPQPVEMLDVMQYEYTANSPTGTNSRYIQPRNGRPTFNHV